MLRSARALVIAVPAALAVAAVVGVVFFFPWNAPSSSSRAAPTASPTTSSPAPRPSETPAPSPTQDATPEPVVTDQVQPEPTPAGPGAVTVVSWGADGVNLYASGIVTGDVGNNGTCTLTATSSSGAIITGRRDAQSTPAAVNCGVIQVPAPPGDWTLVLAYRSDTATAFSAATEVTQP